MKYLHVLFMATFLFKHAESVLQNCTASPCDLKTCSPTSSKCYQTCSALPCKTECSSPAGCDANCISGGCSKMSCNIAESLRKECALNCKKNCPDMQCSSHLCYPKCDEDGCKLSCFGYSNQSQCYPRCLGKGCEINCLSFYCEADCFGGNCLIRFSKRSEGETICTGGNCKLICPKGKTCRFRGQCPNCTTQVVDDPFAKSSADGLFSAIHLIIFSLFSVFVTKFI